MNWNIFEFNELESTNTTALSYPVYSVILAKKQTAGKGRLGRKWESPEGNLYTSFVLPDFKEKSALISFVIALSAGQILSEITKGIQLKWPNDILLDGRKLAGILLEKQNGKLIVGIGINLISCPKQEMLYPTTHLETSLNSKEILEKLIFYFNHNLELFNQGFSHIRTEYKKMLKGIGEPITVNLPNQTLTGIFEDLDETGALLLKRENKIIPILAGDVFFNNKETK